MSNLIRDLIEMSQAFIERVFSPRAGWFLCKTCMEPYDGDHHCNPAAAILKAREHGEIWRAFCPNCGTVMMIENGRCSTCRTEYVDMRGPKMRWRWSRDDGRDPAA